MQASNGQGSADSSTGSTPVVAADQRSGNVLLRCTDDATDAVLYWGVAPGVSSSNGVPMTPGESMVIPLVDGTAVYCWAANATAYAWAAMPDPEGSVL